MMGDPSHRWAGPDAEWRCVVCDCRPGGRVAQWPCGTEPPASGTLTMPYSLIDQMAEESEREPGGLS